MFPFIQWNLVDRVLFEQRRRIPRAIQQFQKGLLTETLA
jgi:hypothetical protein